MAVRREALTKDLETKAASLAALRKEVQVSTGADKSRPLWMIKSEAASAEQARKNLELFESQLFCRN